MLTDEQRSTIEEILLRERSKLVAALEQFTSEAEDLRERTGEISVHRFHLADIGTETMEKEKEFLLASREGRRLYEIDEALRRLYKEPQSFGICERCGEATFSRERTERIRRLVHDSAAPRRANTSTSQASCATRAPCTCWPRSRRPARSHR
jgi:DnaK suppressor protein